MLAAWKSVWKYLRLSQPFQLVCSENFILIGEIRAPDALLQLSTEIQ